MANIDLNAPLTSDAIMTAVHKATKTILTPAQTTALDARIEPMVTALLTGAPKIGQAAAYTDAVEDMVRGFLHETFTDARAADRADRSFKSGFEREVWNSFRAKIADTVAADETVNLADTGHVAYADGGRDVYLGSDAADTVSYVDARAAVKFTLDSRGDVSAAKDAAGTAFDTLRGIDEIVGSARNDLFRFEAAARGFVLDGGAGNDSLETGGGADQVHGGTGNDALVGGGGNDRLWGDDGNDSLDGGEGDDVLDGGAGNDRLVGGVGADTLSGMDGNDKIEGGQGNDTVNGNLGNDEIIGNEGDDWLSGGQGNDKVWGGKDNDHVFGGLGNDDLRGGLGDDELNGGEGNDSLLADGGADRLIGGGGRDVFVWEASALDGARDVVADFVRGQDRIDLHLLDANTATARNDAFAWLGSGAFTGKAGQLRYADGVVSADLNGDKAADLQILIEGSPALARSDFLL